MAKRPNPSAHRLNAIRSLNGALGRGEAWSICRTLFRFLRLIELRVSPPSRHRIGVALFSLPVVPSKPQGTIQNRYIPDTGSNISRGSYYRRSDKCPIRRKCRIVSLLVPQKSMPRESVSSVVVSTLSESKCRTAFRSANYPSFMFRYGTSPRRIAATSKFAISSVHPMNPVRNIERL